VDASKVLKLGEDLYMGASSKSKAMSRLKTLVKVGAGAISREAYDSFTAPPPRVGAVLAT